MSIGKKVSRAMDELQAGDAEEALYQISSAVEATAKAEYGTGGRGNYKNFIHDNFGLITKIAFGHARILKLRIGYSHPEIKSDADGTCSIEEVFYHAVRCGLAHETKLPHNLVFTDEQAIKPDKSGTLFLPKSLVMGLIVAVVVSPANAGEKADKPCGIQYIGLNIPVEKMWGKRAELIRLHEAVDAFL